MANEFNDRLNASFKTSFPFPVIVARRPNEKIMVRRMTLGEIKALSSGSHAEFIANDGTLRTVKINGAPKTWKTRPQDVSVSVKYGLYEYARFETTEALERFVVRVGN